MIRESLCRREGVIYTKLSWGCEKGKGIPLPAFSPTLSQLRIRQASVRTGTVSLNLVENHLFPAEIPKSPLTQKWVLSHSCPERI